MKPSISTRCVLVLAGLFAFAAASRAATPNAQIASGDSFRGAIADAADSDEVDFVGLAGEKVTGTLSRAKKSKLKPVLELIDAGSGTVLASAQGGKKAAIQGFALPATGVFRWRASGSSGSTGAYQLATKASLGKDALAPLATPSATDPEAVDVAFVAHAGTRLTVKVTPKAAGADAGSPQLVGPSGAIDIAPYTALDGDGLKVTKVPLPEFGAYVFTVKNEGTAGAGLKVVASLELKKAKKKVVYEPVDGMVSIQLSPPLPAAFTTKNAELKVAGEIVLLEPIAPPVAVVWQRQGAKGEKSGTFALSAASAFDGTIPLDEGDNVVRIGAPGYAGMIELQVTRNKGYQFGGLLELTPDVVYVGEGRILTARIALTDDSTDEDDVMLVRVEGDDEIPSAVLTDDGDLQIGDEVDGDKIFTGKFQLTAFEPGEIEFRVVVNGGSQPERSESVSVLATTHLSDAELSSVLALQQQKQAQIDAALASGTLDATLATILGELDSDPTVAQAGLSSSGKGIWVVYESGVAGVLMSMEDSVKAGGRPERGAAAAPVLRSPVSSPPYQGWLDIDHDLAPAPASGDGPQFAQAAANEIGSSKALAIAAQFFDWGNSDDVPAMKTKLEAAGCYDVDYITYASAGAGSVEDFKNLGKYGVILISSHGDSFYSGILSLWQDVFGWNYPFGLVVLHSNMAATTANKVKYEDDLKRGRLVLWYGSYGMTPTFISRYSGALPNSLVYMSICRGSWNGSLANAFLGQGAGAYFGYSDYVAVSFCQSLGPPLLDKLLVPDNTVADAFVPGLVESDADPAEFRHFGSKTLALEAGQLNDGSFESGNLQQAWTPAGDARIVPELGPFQPVDGNLMGIVSTGLGFTTTSGSIEQDLCLPEKAAELSFRWNFLSEEFVEYCGSQYQDTFTVTLTDVDDAGNKATALDTWVDKLCGSVSPVGIAFDQGDVHATGWRTTSFAVPASLQGKRAVLRFECSDVGDSIYDTAILIDKIALKSN